MSKIEPKREEENTFLCRYKVTRRKKRSKWEREKERKNLLRTRDFDSEPKKPHEPGIFPIFRLTREERRNDDGISPCGRKGPVVTGTA